ncbi:MAG TPA: hypothetical protein DIW43_07070 [Spongiibacteraceae bacterium]|nr:hypothetical protein [Spongiibacteraceae bacterium]HCS27197.1 hypothetical protein [Spongiibacteraceae bacterium]
MYFSLFVLSIYSPIMFYHNSLITYTYNSLIAYYDCSLIAPVFGILVVRCHSVIVELQFNTLE